MRLKKRKQRRRRSAAAALKSFHRQLARVAGRALADDWTARLKRLGRAPQSKPPNRARASDELYRR